MIHRCFNFIPIKTHVLILSILDVLYSVVLLALTIQAFYPALKIIWQVQVYYGYLIPFVFATGTFILQAIFAVVLFHGVQKSKRVLIQAWLLISTLFVILKSITVVVHLITGNHDHDLISYALLIDCVFKVYQTVVLILFMSRELQENEHDYRASGTEAILIYNKDSENI